MIGLGVSSFSHFDGVHFQNLSKFEDYVQSLEGGQLPLWRALALTPKQRLIREMILQLKTGALDAAYFRSKFGVDVWQEFQSAYERLRREELVRRDNRTIEPTPRGLPEVDLFLSAFFEPELNTVRYA